MTQDSSPQLKYTSNKLSNSVQNIQNRIENLQAMENQGLFSISTLTGIIESKLKGMIF